MSTESGRKPEPPHSKSEIQAGPKSTTRPATRSAALMSGYDYDPNVAFTMARMCQPKNKLPNLASFVGMLRFYQNLKKSRKGGISPAREVAKILTVFTVLSFKRLLE